jgi:transposase
LTDWLPPQRASAPVAALRGFQTPPGKLAQLHWGHLGTLEMAGQQRKLWGFPLTLGYSRIRTAAAARKQKLGRLSRLHEEAFRQLAGVPEVILYDRIRTVWLRPLWSKLAPPPADFGLHPAAPGGSRRLPKRLEGPRIPLPGPACRPMAAGGGPAELEQHPAADANLLLSA